MLGALLLALIITLSLCAVPALARYTVFPLLSSLILKFTSTYLLPSLEVEYRFGALQSRQQLRGVSIILRYVRLQPEFLKSLAFEHKGTAPIVLTSCNVKQVTIGLASTWRVVINVDEIHVDANILNDDPASLITLEDAVNLKIAAADGWIGRLIAEKTKQEKRIAEAAAADGTLVNASTPLLTTQKFSFKDRVIQLVMAQVEVDVDSVQVAILSSPTGSNSSTTLNIGFSSLQIDARVEHDSTVNDTEALDLVLTSENARVEYDITLKDLAIHLMTPESSPSTSTSALSDKEDEVLALPSIKLGLNVPPMAKVLGIVEPIAPIPCDRRTAKVTLSLSDENIISVNREKIMELIVRIAVPFANYQNQVQTMRYREAARTVITRTEDEKTFNNQLVSYREKYAISSDPEKLKNLKAAEVTELTTAMKELEEKMTLDEILECRSETQGFPKFFNPSDEHSTNKGWNLNECQRVLNDLQEKSASDPRDIMFRSMYIGLQIQTWSIDLSENDGKVAQLQIKAVDINVEQHAIPNIATQEKLQLQLSIQNLLVEVNDEMKGYTSLLGSSDNDAKLLTLKFAQLENTQQNINLAVHALRLLLDSTLLQQFLMYVDRVTTSVSQSMITINPPAVGPIETPTALEPQVEEEEVLGSNATTEEVTGTPFSLLGGQLLDVKVSIDDSILVLIPTVMFAEAFRHVNSELQMNNSTLNCRVELPIALSLSVMSSKTKESILLDIAELGLDAKYLDFSVDGTEKNEEEIEFEAEDLLATRAIAIGYDLHQDSNNSLLCCQNVKVHLPDLLFTLTDLSLALLASCVQALTEIQTTTPEQAELRRLNSEKQEELRRTAAIKDAIDRLRTAFDAIDADKSGTIEVEELFQLIKRAHLAENLLESELRYFVQLLFEEIDDDQNGSLDFDEVSNYLHTGMLVENSRSGKTSNLLGFLNLRGAEYTTFSKLGKDIWKNERLICLSDVSRLLRSDPDSFWTAYEHEICSRQTTFSTNAQIRETQKKLVRLMENYDGAELAWISLLEPINGSDWLLNPLMSMGGVADYPDATSVVRPKGKGSKKGIFSAEFHEEMDDASAIVDPGRQDFQLHASTDVQLGNLRIILTDLDLPAHLCRGDFNLQDLKFSIDLKAKNIPEKGKIDWLGLATAGSLDWTALFGLRIVASTYSELARAMENVIEPWQFNAGASGVEKESGFSLLMEAEKRLQINITPSLLQSYGAIKGVVGGSNPLECLQKRQESIHNILLNQQREAFKQENGTDLNCLVQNCTDIALFIQVEEDQWLEVAPNDQLFVPEIKNNVLQGLKIGNWGQAKVSTSLISFGTVSVPIVSTESSHTILLSAYCRLDDATRQLIVFKSNLYLKNHSSGTYEVKYLQLGDSKEASTTSDVMKLSANERVSLPLSLLMSTVELYAKPESVDSWIVKATLDSDIMTGESAQKSLNDVGQRHAEMKHVKKKGQAIVCGVTEETSSSVVEQLTPNVLVRLWQLDGHVEWEVTVLPPFVIRNSLPYMMEYKFLEYSAPKRPAGARHSISDFADVEAQLQSESDNSETDLGHISNGSVESGADAEIAGLTCLSPGYLSVRLVTVDAITKLKGATSWSKPLLMSVHGTIDRFTSVREIIEIRDAKAPEMASGMQCAVDRLTLTQFPRVVRFNSPCWIVNNTALNIAVAPVDEDQKSSTYTPMFIPNGFSYPVITSLKSDLISIKPTGAKHLRPEVWSSLGTVSPKSYNSADEQDCNWSWSTPINSTTINTVGECLVGESALAVKVSGLYGSFESSVAVTFAPRFILKNHLKEPIRVHTFASPEENPAKVDAAFRSKYLKVAHEPMILTNGETYPVHHFPPLKSGDSLAKCKKYLAFSLKSGSEDDIKWSFAIPVNAAGDVQLEVYSALRKQNMIVQASVQVIDMYVYVVLSDVTIRPPYRIENYSPFPLQISQLQGSDAGAGSSFNVFASAAKSAEQAVARGTWHAFAWHNPLSKDRNIQIAMISPIDGEKPRTKEYDIDEVGYHESIIMTYEDVSMNGKVKTRQKMEFIVQVVVDEGTRVLKLVEKSLEMARLHDQSTVENSDDADKPADEESAKTALAKAPLEPALQLRKLLYASSFDIRIAGLGLSLLDAFPQEVFFASIDTIQVLQPAASLEWTVSIFHLQVDSMLVKTKFPVLINPIESGYSSIESTPKPLLKIVLDADIAAKVGIYKLLDFQLQGLAVKVDLDYIMQLVKLLETYLVTTATVNYTSRKTLQTTLHNLVPPVPVISDEVQLLYFDVLRIGALSIGLEYAISRKDIVQASGGGGSVVSGLISQVVGLIGSNLSGSPTFSFSEILIARCFSTQQQIISRLIQNFVRQAIFQAYKLVASVDILGDPVGLVGDLGSGVVEFLKITKGELMGDSKTRGEGVKVLGKTLVGTSAGALSKITGSLDKFVGDLDDSNADDADDDDDQNGSFKFAKDLGKGLTGIFTKPVEGAMKGGVAGLVTGTVSGLAGPGVVLLKGITSTSHTLALGVQNTVVDRSVFGGRRRLPKLIVDDRLIADYDEKYYKPSRMTLEVREAQGLASDSSCDPLCVVRIGGKDVFKTNVLYNTVNPKWFEKTQLALNGTEDEVQFIVKDSYGGAIDKTLGKVIIGMEDLLEDFQRPEYSSDLAKWVHTGIKPTDTTKNESHQVTERGYHLVDVKAKAKLEERQKTMRGGHLPKEYQVRVTVVELVDYQPARTSGGFLGLGGGASIPDISPYISIHVGKGWFHTSTTTMNVKQNTDGVSEGNASWNETYSFSLTEREFYDANGAVHAFLSLKDKSILRDDTLCYSDIELSEKGMHGEDLVTLELREKKRDKQGKVLGHLTAKFEVRVIGGHHELVKDDEEDKEDTPGRTTRISRSYSTESDGGARRVGKLLIGCEFF